MGHIKNFNIVALIAISIAITLIFPLPFCIIFPVILCKTLEHLKKRPQITSMFFVAWIWTYVYISNAQREHRMGCEFRNDPSHTWERSFIYTDSERWWPYDQNIRGLIDVYLFKDSAFGPFGAFILWMLPILLIISLMFPANRKILNVCFGTTIVTLLLISFILTFGPC